MRSRARSLLALLAILFATNVSAGPVTYDYRFLASGGDLVALGTFTTDAASTVDPGYFLLTAMTLTQVRDGNGNLLSGLVSTTTFQPGAAFDPSTFAFLNHAVVGMTYNDLGDTLLLGGIGPDRGILVTGQSFSALNFGFDARLLGPSPSRPYAATLAISPVAAAIPEPSTFVLLAAGLLAGLPLLLRRRSRMFRVAAAVFSRPPRGHRDRTRLRPGARLLLAAVGVLTSTGAAAGPITYDYRFTATNGDLLAVGTFTTDAASSVDPGYFLVTAITLAQVRDGDGNLLTGFVSTTTFQPGAAFDPSTFAFVNHALGDTYDDLGFTQLRGNIGPDQGVLLLGSFAAGSSRFEARFRGPSNDASYGDTTLAISEVAAAIPEPATSALMAAALLVGLPLLRRRGSRTFRTTAARVRLAM